MEFQNPVKNPVRNPFRNPFSGQGETPLVDFKHVSHYQIKNMTPEEIGNLDTRNVGFYQTKYLDDKWGLTPEQNKAFSDKLSEKTRENMRYSPLYGGKTRRRKQRKSRKSRKHKKSRRSRK